jgi:hypothetical protein
MLAPHEREQVVDAVVGPSCARRSQPRLRSPSADDLVQYRLQPFGSGDGPQDVAVGTSLCPQSLVASRKLHRVNGLRRAHEADSTTLGAQAFRGRRRRRAHRRSHQARHATRPRPETPNPEAIMKARGTRRAERTRANGHRHPASRFQRVPGGGGVRETGHGELQHRPRAHRRGQRVGASHHQAAGAARVDQAWRREGRTQSYDWSGPALGATQVPTDQLGELVGWAGRPRCRTANSARRRPPTALRRLMPRHYRWSSLAGVARTSTQTTALHAWWR